MTTATPAASLSTSLPSAAGSRQRVLVVDDEPDILDEMRELLETKGLSVRVAASAAEALTLLAHDPELNTVVSDIRMPLVDGVQMIDSALQDPALKDRPLRFIMVTGHATLADAQRSMRASAVDFVPKPINTDQLMQAIGRAAAQIAEVRGRRQRQEELATKADAERRQRLEVSAQNVTLEALVAVAREKRTGDVLPDVEVTLTRLGEVLQRTVDGERHRHVASQDQPLPSVFAAFLRQVAAQLGLPLAGLATVGKPLRGLPPPAVEDAAEALLLGLKLRGASSLGASADFAADRSDIRLLPEASPAGSSHGPMDVFAAEAAQLALAAAEISVSRFGGILTIEDVDATRQAILVRFPLSPDAR